MLLFDMDKDPHETTNLAYNPIFRNIVLEESKACDDFMKKFYPTLPTSVIPALVQNKLTLNTITTQGKVVVNPNVANDTYTENAVVTLTPTAKKGYKFIGWSGGAKDTTNPITVVMNEAKTISANFSFDGN